MAERFDAIIVGGGIAGSGLGAVLARGGKSVLILERSSQFEDMVRGEWVAPWGVVDAKRTGLYEVLLRANEHHITSHVEYGDGIDPDAAEANVLDLGFLPGIPGPLAVGHPQACQALFDAAIEAGATTVRGVTAVAVSPGPSPRVQYTVDGVAHEATCRIVAGADGRGSVVRRQAGIELEHDKTHHFFAGLLVDQAEAWPAELQTMGTEGDVQFFVFPQGNGRARLYLGFATEQKSRFAGADKEQRFLDAFRLTSVPRSDALANARIAGPCHAIPNHSTWTDSPIAPGMLLLGDAAGYNDPIIGQGLSIAMRDIRVVSELMLGSASWNEALFAPYVEERTERMRRLRLAVAMDSIIHAEFGPEATARKLRIFGLQRTDPTITMARSAVMIGPELIPATAFTGEALVRVANA